MMEGLHLANHNVYFLSHFRPCFTEKLLADVFTDFHLLLLIKVKNDGMAFASCKSCFSRAL